MKNLVSVAIVLAVSLFVEKNVSELLIRIYLARNNSKTRQSIMNIRGRARDNSLVVLCNFFVRRCDAAAAAAAAAASPLSVRALARLHSMHVGIGL